MESSRPPPPLEGVGREPEDHREAEGETVGQACDQDIHRKGLPLEPLEASPGHREPDRIAVDGEVRHGALPAEESPPLEVPADDLAALEPIRVGLHPAAGEQQCRDAGARAAGAQHPESRLDGGPPAIEQAELEEGAVATPSKGEREIALYGLELPVGQVMGLLP